MNRNLKSLIIEGLKSVGIKDCLGYIEERLTSAEYVQVKDFLTYVTKNKETIGHGNIDALWLASGKRKPKKKLRTAKFPLSDWQYEVANCDTILGYAEWREHKMDIFQQESKAIRDCYIDGRCPDCGEKIPEDVVEGDECKLCGHVFTGNHNHE